MAKRNPLVSMVKQAMPKIGRFLTRAVPKVDEQTRETLAGKNVDVSKVLPEEIDMVVRALRETVVGWREFKTLKRFHETNRILAKRVNTLEEYHKQYELLSLESWLLSGAGRLVFRVLRGADTGAACDEVLAGFRFALKGGKVPIVVGAAIPELSLPDKPTKLDATTELRCLTHEERLFAFDQPLFAGYGFSEREEQPGGPAVILSGRSRKVEDYLDAWPGFGDGIRQDIQAAIAFLNLYLDEKIRPRRLFVGNEEWLPNASGSCSRMSSRMQLYPDPPQLGLFTGGPEYKVTEETAKKLVKIWPRYRQALSDGRFRRAATRYSLSLHRDSQEDALVDHWVALESLFGARTSVGATVSVKLALLLESKQALRRALRNQVGKHYKIRNAVVHGGDLKSALKGFDKVMRPALPASISMSPHVAAFFSRDWVRRSLVRLAEHFASLDELDDVLLQGKLKYDLEKEIKQLPAFPAFLKRLAAESER